MPFRASAMPDHRALRRHACGTRRGDLSPRTDIGQPAGGRAPRCELARGVMLRRAIGAPGRAIAARSWRVPHPVTASPRWRRCMCPSSCPPFLPRPSACPRASRSRILPLVAHRPRPDLARSSQTTSRAATTSSARAAPDRVRPPAPMCAAHPSARQSVSHRAAWRHGSRSPAGGDATRPAPGRSA